MDIMSCNDVYAKLIIDHRSGKCCTFDKHLCETLVFPDHTLVRGVIGQARFVDGERSDVAVCLHDVPSKQSKGGAVMLSLALRLHWSR